MKMPGFTLLASLLATGGVLSASAIGQVKPNATAEDVGLYSGRDRLQRLLEGAKKEKELNLYTSAQSDDMGALVGAYEKKYGMKVNIWRASSEKVLQRAVAEAQGTKLFKEIVAKNGMSVRKGHTLLAQLVVSGEVPLALTVYNYKAEQFKGKGAPIDWFSIGTAIARPNGVGVARRAPHPHAAVLFYDFEISEEGQKILAQRDFVPTSRTVDTPLNTLPLKFVDARVTLDEYDKWVKLYEEIFGAGAR